MSMSTWQSKQESFSNDASLRQRMVENCVQLNLRRMHSKANSRIKCESDSLGGLHLSSINVACAYWFCLQLWSLRVGRSNMTPGDVTKQIDAQNKIASTRIFSVFTGTVCQKRWSTKQTKQNGMANLILPTDTEVGSLTSASPHTCNQTILNSYPQYFYPFRQEPARYAYAHKRCPCLSTCLECVPHDIETRNP